MADFRDEDDARSRISARLLPGERIVWIGQPDPSVNFTAADAFLIPFSVLWFGFAIVWTVFASRGAGGYFGLFGLPFLAFGAYYTVGRFVYKRWNKRLTSYAITTQRAMVLVGTRSFRDVPAAGQQLSIRSSRSGDHESVTFGPPIEFSVFRSRSRYPNTGLDLFTFLTPQSFAFYDVSDVAGLTKALDGSRQLPGDRITNA